MVDGISYKQISQMAITDYPSDRAPPSQRPKTYGVKSERNAMHEFYHSATPPCIDLKIDEGDAERRSAKAESRDRKSGGEERGRPKTTKSSRDADAQPGSRRDDDGGHKAHRGKATSTASHRNIEDRDGNKPTSETRPREFVYRPVAKHAASESDRHSGGGHTRTPHDDAIGAPGRYQYDDDPYGDDPRGWECSGSRSCQMVCEGGVCRLVRKSADPSMRPVSEDDGGYDYCRTPLPWEHRMRTMPHPSLTFDPRVLDRSPERMCAGSTCSLRNRGSNANPTHVMGQPPMDAWDEEHGRNWHPGFGGPCAGGVCRLLKPKPPSNGHAFDAFEYNNGERIRGQWPISSEDPSRHRAWRSSATDIEYFLPNEPQSRPSSPDICEWPRLLQPPTSGSSPIGGEDGEWTVLADLSQHREDDEAADEGGGISPGSSRRPTDIERPHSPIPFSQNRYANGAEPNRHGDMTNGSHKAIRFEYDKGLREHGWQFEVPGDPYCLNTSNPGSGVGGLSPVDPGLVAHRWETTGVCFGNSRPPLRPREYIVHPEFVTEQLCPIDKSKTGEELEQIRQRHYDAARIQRQRYQQPRYVHNTFPM